MSHTFFIAILPLHILERMLKIFFGVREVFPVRKQLLAQVSFLYKYVCPRQPLVHRFLLCFTLFIQ